MLKEYWKKFAKMLNARSRQERILLMAVAVALPAYAWMILFYEPRQLTKAGIDQRIAGVASQINEEVSKQAEIRSTYTVDPNVFARTRLEDLRTANAEADEKLNELYSQLINPREMSQMLARILQKETTLELISLRNEQSELLLTTSVSADGSEAGSKADVEVYRHGLQMVFEGSYLETLSFLRNLEQLQNNFFWEALDYSVTDYPTARITLDIYTLSTQKGWIGV